MYKQVINERLIQKAQRDLRFLRVIDYLKRDFELGIRNPTMFDSKTDLAYGTILSTTGGTPTTTTTITLNSGQGATFPAANFPVAFGDPLWNRAQIAASEEIAYCSSRSGDVLTLSGRHLYGPNGARSLAAGDYVIIPVVKKWFDDIENRLLVPSVNSASLSNPVGTTSGTLVQCGFARTFTPATNSGKVDVAIIFDITSSAIAQAYAALTYGTGSAPGNGVAATGTQLTPTSTTTIVTGGYTYRVIHTGIITGLSKGTTYWYDACQASGGGTVNMVSVNIKDAEIGGVWS